MSSLGNGPSQVAISVHLASSGGLYSRRIRTISSRTFSRASSNSLVFVFASIFVMDVLPPDQAPAKRESDFYANYIAMRSTIGTGVNATAIPLRPSRPLETNKRRQAPQNQPNHKRSRSRGVGRSEPRRAVPRRGYYGRALVSWVRHFIQSTTGGTSVGAASLTAAGRVAPR